MDRDISVCKWIEEKISGAKIRENSAIYDPENGEEPLAAKHTGWRQESEFRLKKEIGERIRSMRDQRGLNQDVLGGKAGIARGRIIELEKGRTDITVHEVLNLAHALDCTAADLLPPALTERKEMPFPPEVIAAMRSMREWLDQYEE